MKKIVAALLLLGVSFVCTGIAQVRLNPLRELSGEWVMIVSLVLPFLLAALSFSFLQSRGGLLPHSDSGAKKPIFSAIAPLMAVILCFATYLLGVLLLSSLLTDNVVVPRSKHTKIEPGQLRKDLGFNVVIQEAPDARKLIFVRAEGRKEKIETLVDHLN